MMFIEAFAEELTKMAAPHLPEGLVQRLGSKMPQVARMLAVGGGGAAVGHALGKRRGERQGVEEGTAMTGDIAERAYRVGVQRGALAMRDALVQSAQGASKPNSTGSAR